MTPLLLMSARALSGLLIVHALGPVRAVRVVDRVGDRLLLGRGVVLPLLHRLRFSPALMMLLPGMPYILRVVPRRCVTVEGEFLFMMVIGRPCLLLALWCLDQMIFRVVLIFHSSSIVMFVVVLGVLLLRLFIRRPDGVAGRSLMLLTLLFLLMVYRLVLFMLLFCELMGCLVLRLMLMCLRNSTRIVGMLH